MLTKISNNACRYILTSFIFVLLYSVTFDSVSTIHSQAPSCPNNLAPRLQANTTARILDGQSNNLRNRASLNGSLLDQIPATHLIAVIDGPVCADGYTWWDVIYNDTRGWTVEGDSSNYWIEPLDTVSSASTPIDLDDSVIFFEDFSDNSNGWGVSTNVGHGEFGVANGVYFVDYYSPEFNTLNAAPGTLETVEPIRLNEPFELQFEVRNFSYDAESACVLSNFNILEQGQNGNGFVYCDIDGQQGWGFVNDGEWVEWDDSLATSIDLFDGGVHTFKSQLGDDEYRFEVDNTLIAVIAADGEINGGIRLDVFRATDTSFNMYVEFDNVMIRHLEMPSIVAADNVNPTIIPTSQNTTAQQSFEDGLSLLDLENYEAAIEALSRAIEEDPQFAPAFNARGRAYVANEMNVDAAIADFESAVEIDDNYAEAYANLANALYLKENNEERAMELVTRALALDPNLAFAHLVKGNLLKAMDDPDNAILSYNRAIELDPRLADAYYRRGQAFYLLEDYSRTLQNMNQAIALDPKSAMPYAYRGIMAAFDGNLSEALEDLDYAAQLEPDNPDVYNIRSVAFAVNGDIDQAIVEANAAIEADPDSADGYYWRGILKAEGGYNHQDILADFNTAIEIDPLYTDAYFQRALIYEDMADFDRAIEDYTQIINIDPQYADAYYNRGIIYFNEMDSCILSLPDFYQYSSLAESLGFEDVYNIYVYINQCS